MSLSSWFLWNFFPNLSKLIRQIYGQVLLSSSTFISGLIFTSRLIDFLSRGDTQMNVSIKNGMFVGWWLLHPCKSLSDVIGLKCEWTSFQCKRKSVFLPASTKQISKVRHFLYLNVIALVNWSVLWYSGNFELIVQACSVGLGSQSMENIWWMSYNFHSIWFPIKRVP